MNINLYQFVPLNISDMELQVSSQDNIKQKHWNKSMKRYNEKLKASSWKMISRNYKSRLKAPGGLDCCALPAEGEKV